jgi:O-antigen/teichoic acid export membrane protein
MISYGLFVLAGGASAILVSKVDMMMIGKLMNLESVAYYTIAFFIGNVILVPSRAIGSITAPLIAKAWKEKNISEIKEIYEKSSLNQLLLGGFIFLIIWLNIDEGLALLPEKFQGGKYVVLYIALSKLFSVATGVNGQIIINSKYYRFDLYSNFILLIITIFTNYIFIPESSPLSEYNIVGINGAAFATALSVIIFNSLKMMYVYFKVGIQPFSFRTIKSILLIIFVYFSLMFLNLTFLDIPNMIVKSLLISIIYFSIMFVLRISEDLNSMIKDLWNNLVS